jgi:hypothetical protein
VARRPGASLHFGPPSHKIAMRALAAGVRPVPAPYPGRVINMSKTFKCPSCGGPLDYAGGEALTVRCPFCSNSVIVPPELRSQQAAPPASGPLADSVPPDPSAPAPAAPSADPALIKTQIRDLRHAEREKRRALRLQLREARRRSRNQ